MNWLSILKLFQSKIGKVLFGFIKSKGLRKWFKKGLFNKDLFDKIFEKDLFQNGQSNGKKVKRSRRRAKEI